MQSALLSLGRVRGMRACESLEETACGAFQHLNTRNLLQLIREIIVF
jgi:hypothetical protein